MSKVENLYLKLTGIKPSNLQPPLRGAALEKAVSRLRNPKDGQVPSATLFQRLEVTGYEIIESGTAPVKGGSELYTVIGKNFADGHVEATFVFGQNLRDEDLVKIVPKLSKDRWFTYDPNEMS